MIKDKLRVTLIHLVISTSVLAILLFIVLLIWYPSPYTSISGIGHILLILICIDVIIGPLLTFIVYKKGKSTLKADLSIIVAIQILALTYGVFTVYQGHPVYIVYAVDRFELIPAQDVDIAKVKYDELRISKIWFPKLVYAKKPDDADVKNKLLYEVLSGKPDIERRPEYYEPFDKFAKNILANGIKPEQLLYNPENKRELEAFLQRYGMTANDYTFLPLIGKEKDVLWAWNRKDGIPVDILNINPWELKSTHVATTN